jgi:hypothetical protein
METNLKETKNYINLTSLIARMHDFIAKESEKSVSLKFLLVATHVFQEIIWFVGHVLQQNLRNHVRYSF